MADHRSDGLAREVFRLHESENPPAIRRGARGYTRKHMSVMSDWEGQKMETKKDSKPAKEHAKKKPSSS